MDGHNYNVFVGAASILKRVHYLDMHYDWLGAWGKQSLKLMIEQLQFTIHQKNQRIQNSSVYKNRHPTNNIGTM